MNVQTNKTLILFKSHNTYLTGQKIHSNVWNMKGLNWNQCQKLKTKYQGTQVTNCCSPEWGHWVISSVSDVIQWDICIARSWIDSNKIRRRQRRRRNKWQTFCSVKLYYLAKISLCQNMYFVEQLKTKTNLSQRENCVVLYRKTLICTNTGSEIKPMSSFFQG